MEVFLLGLTATILTVAGISADQRVCWYTSRTVGGLSVQLVETAPDYADESDNGRGQIRGSNQTCPKRTNYCYALWQEVRHNHSVERITIIAQGCWESSGKQDCENVNCVTTRKPPKALNDTNFCCCKGNFCNGNVTQMYYPEDFEVSSISDEKSTGKPYILILVILLVFFILTASCPPAVLLLARNLDKSKNKKDSKFYSDSMHLVENELRHNSNFTNENLKLEKLIGQGRYGSVWKATVGDQDVAVKIFQSHHRQYFFNELDIYCVPFMAHPSLLSYLGYDERMGSDGNTEYLLFLSLVSNGTVKDFLSSNVIDWNTFCKMALSIAKGVAYLHSDIKKGDKFKPCVSHRDLNTTNILVKEDMSCVICDLGFATKISGSKYYYNGEEQHAEVKSINDVGTLRYMSPEVLEGAVNLRDCETALKQIDVYALGLILWEISTRCNDFYPPGMECAPYRLPFEAEIGHPTFEQMQILVCKHKARPLFPDLWRDSPAVRSVKETIEDCWDQDAEARLTALCVEERFHELSGMSERQKVCFHSSNGIGSAARTSLIRRDSQNVLIISENKEESCMSEFTTDTTLGLTPANPKNSNQFQEICSTLSVQPYQGRNPCLERNLMLPKDCDSNSGDFIEKSQKNILQTSSPIPNGYFNVHPADSAAENFTNLIYGGYGVNHSEPVLRSNAPIPFVQNVKVEHAIPKQSNLPKPPNQSRKISWKNFKRIFESRQKSNDPSPQIDFNVKTNLISEENCATALTTPVDSKLETEVLLHNGKLETKINGQGHSAISRGNECSATNFPGVSNKRPNTLPLKKSTDCSSSTLESKRKGQKVTKISNPNGKAHESDRIGAPRAESEITPETAQLETLRLQPRQMEEESLQTVGNNKFLVESYLEKLEGEKGSRPKRDVGQSEKELHRLQIESPFRLTNPSRRVKTPSGDSAQTKIKNSARLSLYDDRIMSIDERRNEEGTLEDRNEMFRSFENVKFSQNVSQ